MQRMEERGRGVCPDCGSPEVAGLLSVFGVASGSGSSEENSPACGPESCVCGFTQRLRNESERAV